MRRITIRRRGRDALNSFAIIDSNCGVCGKRGLVVQYDKASGRSEKLLCNCGSFEGNAAHLHEETCAYRRLIDTKVYRMLTWVDILKYTILGKAFEKSARGNVGLQCGCYSKLQRQVVHIAKGVQKKMPIDKFAQVMSETEHA